MEDPPFIGDWYREQKLGTGSFGMVTLWKNKKTYESVAIKKCHMPMGSKASTDKLRERWENEVRLMTEVIKCENIVSTVKIKPESFIVELKKTNLSKLPLLIMEYCEAGDLRRLLYRIPNCCGLQESEVRAVLKSLRSAISYLHSQRVTHRDIKPENIVIKKYGNVSVYKLTDLGFARSLHIESINASLVGTVEYLAPELITNRKYSNTVDYWSMGIIAFEIICGCRPFIPHASVAQWILQLQQKRSEHICITEDADGVYNFFNTLFPENKLSNHLKKRLEKWLMLALEWNSKQRGHVFEIFDEQNVTKLSKSPTPSPTSSTRPKSVTFADNVAFNSTIPPILVQKIFTMLDEILDEKILTIFSLYSCETLSYPINESTSMIQLFELIEEDTAIPRNEIDVLLPLEQTIVTIESTTKPIDLFLSNFYQKPMIYILRKPTLSTTNKSNLILSENIKPKIPTTIVMLLENDKMKLKQHILKQFGNNCYFFIKNEQYIYETLIDGIRDYILLINHEIVMYRGRTNEMIRLGYSVRGALELYNETICHCKQNLSAKTLDNFNHTFVGWDEQSTKLNVNLLKLCDAIDKISIRYESVLRRSKETLSDVIMNTDNMLESYDITTLEKLFFELRNDIRDKKENDKSHKKLLKFIYNSLKKRDDLLNNDGFVKLQKSLINIQIEMEEILKATEMAIGQAIKYRNEISKINGELLDRAWKLMEHFSTPDALLRNDTRTDENLNHNLPDFTAVMMSSSPTKDDGNNSKNRSNGNLTFKIGASVSNVTDILSRNDLLCFGEGPDLDSLIADNESIMNAMDDLIENGFVDISSMTNSINQI